MIIPRDESVLLSVCFVKYEIFHVKDSWCVDIGKHEIFSCKYDNEKILSCSLLLIKQFKKLTFKILK